MATAAKIDPDFAAAERQARRELAAAFRLAAYHGWDDHIATHMSARLPDGSFLLNPFGLLFDEITASSLMRMDLDGNVLQIPDGCMLNPAAFTIHSAVLAGRPDVNCAIHLHTRDGAAVSALSEGLMPLNQSALTIRHDVAYHDFEGIATNHDERERLQRDLGTRNLMILRNHGTMAVGSSIGAAFARITMLEWACTTQVRTLSMGREIALPSQAAQEAVTAGVGGGFAEGFAAIFWPAMLRKAERDCPGFDA